MDCVISRGETKSARRQIVINTVIIEGQKGKATKPSSRVIKYLTINIGRWLIISFLAKKGESESRIIVDEISTII